MELLANPANLAHMPDLTPFVILAEALQQATEAVEKAGAHVPPAQRAAFEVSCKRLRTKRVELLAWINEQR